MPTELTVGDVNSDGIPDIVATGIYPNTVSLRLSLPFGGYGPEVTVGGMQFPVPWPWPMWTATETLTYWSPIHCLVQ